jgi:hypothetical protein
MKSKFRIRAASVFLVTKKVAFLHAIKMYGGVEEQLRLFWT